MAHDSRIRALLDKADWQRERGALREAILTRPLSESVKWGQLCYGFEGRNIVIIQCMKCYCALGFFKGALLDDADGRLVRPGSHSQAMRQLRFADLAAIRAGEAVIGDFIDKAIQVEKDGLQVDFSKKHDLAYPDELRRALDADPLLAEAFQALTPGRRRGYVLHFSDAKQPETRRRRIENCRPGILAGKGRNER